MTISRRAMLATFAAGCATEPPMPTLTVFELRNYEMRPSGRDALIPMFEAHFLESQEALGAFVIGTFRNLDDPNRFLWLRAFESMQTRHAALDGFYTSAIWLEHRAEANATMIDSDNVLLLRPVSADALGRPGPLSRPGASAALFVVRTYSLPTGGDNGFAARFRRDALPRLTALGAAPLATFATEHAPNSYTRLPVREGEVVFVTVTRFDNAAAFDQHRAALAEIDASLSIRPDIMRLSPTPRSRLR